MRKSHLHNDQQQKHTQIALEQLKQVFYKSLAYEGPKKIQEQYWYKNGKWNFYNLVTCSCKHNFLKQN